MKAFTLIIPYYRNPQMLTRQLQEIALYPPGVETIVIDDGSPEPAMDVVREVSARGGPPITTRLSVYRITKDIPWNREGARNLGSMLASTDWLLHVDIDHVLPVSAAEALLQFEPDSAYAYRFPRYRVGAADATRKKDWAKNGLPDSADFGKVHPHVDSHLMSTVRYWKVGGYDEDFSGVLGGGNEFLKRLERHVGSIDLLPEPICLHVHTRHAVPDASDLHNSREPGAGRAIWARKLRESGGKPNSRPLRCLRFPWERVL